jgi:hypothetical protein
VIHYRTATGFLQMVIINNGDVFLNGQQLGVPTDPYCEMERGCVYDDLSDDSQLTTKLQCITVFPLYRTDVLVNKIVQKHGFYIYI